MADQISFDIETSGLSSCYGHRITCICAKSSNGDTFKKADWDELSIIKDFLAWFSTRRNSMLISANGKDFDIPFIITRAALLGMQKSEYDFLLMFPHYGLQQITKRKISLDDLSTLLRGVPKTGNGLNAITLFQAGKFDELIEYCMSDVTTTEDIYLTIQKLRSAA